MIKAFKTTAIASAIAVTLAGCGGGTSSDTDTAGIGGSGFISTGTITGFGSVYVNGVKFETDSATFDIEGDSSGTSQADLAIGMVVRVNGTINPDGVSGNATSIIFDDQLQGPVSSKVVSADTLTATLSVLGTTVQINRNTTSFDGIAFDFDSIANGDNVEISGYINSGGELIASRVELEDATFINNISTVELKGTITGLSGSSFTINTINIDASSATLDDLPNGLQDGQFVEVEGTFDGANTITATKVENEALELDDSDEFEIEGFITDFVDSSDFKINGIPVNAGGAGVTFIPTSIVLENDLQVEAEGYISNGVLIADEIKLRGGEVKIAAPVTSVDTNTNTFEVSPVIGQPAITISLGTETEMKNEITGDESLTIIDLDVGDFIQLEGFEDSSSVFASQVKIITPDDIEVQANIDETNSDGSITVLRVQFVIDGGTTLKDSSDSTIDENTFNSHATSNPLISVVDSDADGTIEEAEIE